MTNEEAIVLLEQLRAGVEWEFPIGCAAAIDKAVEAMRKQIPMKPKEEWSEPIFSEDKGCQFMHLMCPACEKMEVNQLASYCPRCGQAIDWKEEGEWTNRD